MATFSSGVLRQRFRIAANELNDPPGFVFDETRLPAESNGTGVATGSFYDPNNNAAIERFSIPEISGLIEISDYKSHLYLPQTLFQAGIGDLEDCRLSGVDLLPSGEWQATVFPGVFFDPSRESFLYGTYSNEELVSGNDSRHRLSIKTNEEYPIKLASYWIDEWGQARVFEDFEKKLRFSSINDLSTQTPVAQSDPPLYRSEYSGIRWQYVDTSGVEFIYDPEVPEVILNQTITSGVHARVRRVPWSQTKFQIPLTPVLEISGDITVRAYAEEVFTDTNGLATPALFSAGTITSLLVTRDSPSTRLAGGIDDVSGLIGVDSVTSFDTSGRLALDDGWVDAPEIVDYTDVSGLYFSGLTRDNPQAQRDDALVLQIVSGAAIDGITLSGLDSSTAYRLYYNATIPGSEIGFDQITGLAEIPEISGIGRVDIDLQYTRGLLLSYEPSGARHVLESSGINPDPIVHGASHGILWASTYPLKAERIDVRLNKSRQADGTYGPVFAGSDFMIIDANVWSVQNAPVTKEAISIVAEDVIDVGQIDGNSFESGPITKVSDGNGVARFIYTPPQDITELGYFANVDTVLNGSGLVFVEAIPFSEIYTNGAWTSQTFAVWNDDEYTRFNETSGLFQYSADGRFELVSKISTTGTSGVYDTISPVTPVIGLDENNVPVTVSGSVKTLVYTSGELPGDGAIEAFFVSAEKQITLGLIAPDSNAASKSFTVQVSIPAFMKGEFLFGPIGDASTSAFDSISYLTVNPFNNSYLDIAQSRFDPRQLGNVFRIQGSNSNENLRNKFYIEPDWIALDSDASTATEPRKQFAMRNRFILEV